MTGRCIATGKPTASYTVLVNSSKRATGKIRCDGTAFMDEAGTLKAGEKPEIVLTNVPASGEAWATVVPSW